MMLAASLQSYRLLSLPVQCSTACAAGAHAIGDAFTAIRSGDADAMIAGGTESCIDAITMTGFHRCAWGRSNPGLNA